MPRYRSLQTKPYRLNRRSCFSSVTRSLRKASCKRLLPPHIPPASPATVAAVWFGDTSMWFGDLEIPYYTAPIVSNPIPDLPEDLQQIADGWDTEAEEEQKMFKRCWLQL